MHKPITDYSWTINEYIYSLCVCLFFPTSATKKRMQNVANISILAMFVMYLLTALFGYLTFFGNFPSNRLS